MQTPLSTTMEQRLMQMARAQKLSQTQAFSDIVKP